MKKSLICLILMFLLVMPILAACTDETGVTDDEADIYTMYMIVGEETTPEAINLVELHLNRTMFYRLGVIVKLVALTEAEYNAVIDDKIAEVEAYQAEKKKNKSKKDKDKGEESSESEPSEAESSEDESSEDETSKEVKTGEYWLKVLSDGGEIVIENPQIDIFVAKGYSRYYQLASTGKLTALDEKLNNEAKALKSSIHSTLLTAAKVNNKTYGIPVNTTIGEYTYFALDKELLDKYGFYSRTINEMADLNEFLAAVKENEPDVVPLMNTAPMTGVNFLSEEGFPALVYPNTGELIPAYTNNNVQKYWAMLARYNALGYFESKYGKADRYAARVVTGTLDDIKAQLGDTDPENQKYEYSLYSNPVATNENCIDNMICISATVNSSNLTKVSQIVTAIYTDKDLMDLLTFGVENEHYILDDNKQIERLNNNYMVNVGDFGNPFITTTLAGEDKDKWSKAIQQNIDSTVSRSLGYTFEPKTLTYKKPDENGNEIKVSEPDYVQIIHEVLAEYYPAIMAGTAVDVDYDTLVEQAYEEKRLEFIDKLDGIYRENILNPRYSENIKNEIMRKQGKALRAEAEEEVIDGVSSAVIREMRKKLRKEVEAENPDLDSDEIDDIVAEMLTEKYIEEHFYDDNGYTEEEVELMIEERFNEIVNDMVYDRMAEVVESDKYQRDFEALQKSKEYQDDLNSMLEYDAPAKIEAKCDALIAAAIKEYTDRIVAEIESRVETAVNEFIAANKDGLEMTEDEILDAIGRKIAMSGSAAGSEEGGDASSEAPAEEGEGGETGEDGSSGYKDLYTSWYEFVFEAKLKKSYYSIFGEPKFG